MFNSVDNDVMDWIDSSSPIEIAVMLYGLDRDKGLEVAECIERLNYDKDFDCLEEGQRRLLVDDDELILDDWYGRLQ